MPKTIMLPEEFKTESKVIVLEEFEQRTEKGDLKLGIYKFKWENRYYRIGYVYKKHKVIRSELTEIISPA